MLHFDDNIYYDVSRLYNTNFYKKNDAKLGILVKQKLKAALIYLELFKVNFCSDET